MKSLITVVFALQCLSGFSQKVTSTIELAKGITLTGVVEPFDITKHKYDTCDMEESKGICLIDGAVWFGSDFGLDLPRNQLIKLTLKIKGKEIPLNVTGMYNSSYTGYLNSEHFKIKEYAGGWILYGMFSDGAGTYTTHWRIIKNKSLRQVISNDERQFYWENEVK
jgi:hypothetical protein